MNKSSQRVRRELKRYIFAGLGAFVFLAVLVPLEKVVGGDVGDIEKLVKNPLVSSAVQ